MTISMFFRALGVSAAISTFLFFHSPTEALAQATEAKLRWLGHAATVYTARDGTVLLIDPWLSNPKAPKDFKPTKVDAVLLTHAHFDHVGEGLELAKKFKAPVVASFELTEIAKKKGVKKVLPLNPGGSVDVGPVRVTAVEAVHSSGFKEGNDFIYGGAPLGFVLSEAASPVVYHAGDTGVFEGMRLIAELYKPEIALLPIGGTFVMKPTEAATAAKLLGARTIVPIHFLTFPVLPGTPQELKEQLTKAGSPAKVRELTPGEELKTKEL